MKSLIFYITVCSLFSLSIAAQQNNMLRGKVLFLNSGNTPAVGVEISGYIESAGNANTVYTADDGSYILLFNNASVGQPVNLRMGDKDGKGQLIELVNEREVQKFRIPAIVTDEFEIIVCPKGYRDSIAEKYYKIFKFSAKTELDKVRNRIDSLLSEQVKDYETISALGDKIIRLQQRADSATTYREAFRLASINRDNAPKRVLEYLKLLDAGKSVQEVREALSIEGAAKDMGESISEFNVAIRELETRIDASKKIFDYRDAIKHYDTIITYAEKMEIDRLKMGSYYLKIAKLIYNEGNYERTLNYQQKALKILEKTLDPKHPDLANTYSDIGNTYNALDQDSTALKFHQKAVDIRAEILDPEDPDLAFSYTSIAQTHQALGEHEAALRYYHKEASVLEKLLAHKHQNPVVSYGNIGFWKKILDPKHPDLIASYGNMGSWEDVLEPNYPSLATAYSNIGCIYQFMRQYENALEYQQKSMTIWEAILDPKHPDLAISYNNIGNIYRFLGRYEKALEYGQKAISILETILDLKHPDLAIAYNDIGTTYEALGQYATALKYHQKSMDIREEILGPKHFSLGISYMNIALIYKELKNFQKAIVFHKKCLTIFKEALSENHSYQKRALDIMAGIYYASKDYPQAIATYQKIANTFPEVKEEDFYRSIGQAYAKNKQFKQAHDAFAAYEKLFPNKGVTYHNWAVYYALQDDKEKALENLKKAVELGYNNLKWLKTDDSMDSFRSENTFIEIIKKLEKEQNK